MPTSSKQGWTVATVICAFAIAYLAYIYTLYSPGLILWQPDFLAFMMGGDLRFFPGGYGLLIGILGGGVAAGRMLTAFGLALVMCVLAGAALRNTRYAIPIGIAALAALFTAPSVFNNTLSPSVDMLYSALGLSLLAACFIIAEDGSPERRAYSLQYLLIVFLSLWLWLLRYHAPVLLFAAAIALVPVWRKADSRLVSFVLLALGVLFIFANKPMGYSLAAKEQVWCGLEFRYHRLAKRGVLDGQPRGGDINGYVWDEYAKLKDVSASASLLDYYSPTELIKHGVSNYFHYMRRPLVLLGMASALIALMLKLKRKQALCALIFLAIYTLPLSAAYYTLRASLLTELAGLALAVCFAGEVLAAPEVKKQALAFTVFVMAFLGVIAASTPRLCTEIREWQSQLVEANEVHSAIQMSGATSTGIWTEDTGITIRLKDEPIAETPHAYNSWLIFASSAVPPRDLVAGKDGSYYVLLIRTPELVQEMAQSGVWNVEDVRSKTRVLYILTRKGNEPTRISGKQ
jgi:hypothetical protein